MISIDMAEHSTWGEACDRSHLVNRPEPSVIRERMPAGAAGVSHLRRSARHVFCVVRGEAGPEAAGIARTVGADGGESAMGPRGTRDEPG